MRKLLLVFSILPLWARAAAPAGTIELSKGGVFILDSSAKVVADPEGKRARTTKPGAPFYVGETIQTKSDGRVKLKFAEGGNEVVLGSGTTLVIRKAGTGSGPSGTDLALEQGQLRSNVKRRYSGEDGDTYEVRTRNAVAGVRGTIFVASFDAAKGVSAIITEKGLVSVASIKTVAPPAGAGANAAPSVELGAPIAVSPGQVTTVEGARPPAAPAPLASKPELKQMVESLDSDKSASSDSSSSKDKGGAAPAKTAQVEETPLTREPVVAKKEDGRTPASTGSDSSSPAKPALMGETKAAAPAPAAGMPSTVGSQVTRAASDLVQQVNQTRQAEQAASGSVGKAVFIVE
jgi:hypothetical protein